MTIVYLFPDKLGKLSWSLMFTVLLETNGAVNVITASFCFIIIVHI